MGRPKDQQFWDCVERIDGGLQCKFCQKVLNGNPSISRIKSHLSGVTGRGVHICKKVSDEVKLAAYEAIQESNDSRQARPTSSNTVVHRNQVEGQVGIQQMSFKHHAPGVENFTENNGGEPVQPIETREEFQPWNQFLTTDYCTPSLETMLMDLGIQPNENTGEALPTTGLIDEEIQPNENRREALLTTESMGEEIQPIDNRREALVRELMGEDFQGPVTDKFLAEVIEKVVDKTTEIVGACWNIDEIRPTLKRKVQELEGHEADRTKQLRREESSGGHVLDHEDETCKLSFPTTELVGEAFQINKLKILRRLKKDEVLSIGIYGMGGIGKTTLVKHIHNQLLQSHLTVYWITVSQDFSTYRFQNLIANKIGLDLSREGDSFEKAAKLSKALEKKQKCVLILDDLWDYFDLNEVGIPVRANGCKLIITTRSLDVCKKMRCQEIIAVNPLIKEEAWRLFQKALGETLPSSVTEIAKSITKECDGLPLGIATMAGSMRGVDDVCEWRNALRELQQSEVKEGDMEEKVFRVLRFSYDRLMIDSKQCFLSCALFPEDYKIRREELIEYLIDEEVIKGESRQAKLDKCHTMLNRLEKVCLLEGVTDEDDIRYVKMHDLIRDMAIQIMERNRGVMVKAGAQLVEIPDYDKWGVDIVKVSLMYNNIEEIPSAHSPRCPNLSTLLLRGNVGLKRISDSFFEQLIGLKILDLSYMNIDELPSSISHLVNLNALVLRRCCNLKQIPSLALLKILKKLDLFECLEVENVPQGMEMLSNLRYLDLRGTNMKELCNGMFANLSHLQVLLLDDWLEVKGKDLESLGKLETLECTFPDIGEFKIFTTSTPSSNLNHYILYVGPHRLFGDGQLRQCMVERIVYFESQDFSEGEDALLLPQNAEILKFFYCNIRNSSLCLKNATELKHLDIKNCNGIECLLSGEDDVAPPPPAPSTIPLSVSPPRSTFSLLKEFRIRYCPRMKKLFPPGMVSNLQNLETLQVEYCAKIEEIFTMVEGQENHDADYDIGFALPKLQSLSLVNLPELKSICGGNIICNSLKTITVINCEKLKRMPLSLVLLENDQLSPLPSLKTIQIFPEEWWWESAELVHPNAKNLLSPLIDRYFYFLRAQFCRSKPNGMTSINREDDSRLGLTEIKCGVMKTEKEQRQKIERLHAVEQA